VLGIHQVKAHETKQLMAVKSCLQRLACS